VDAHARLFDQGAVDVVEELHELLVAVALADHLAGGDVERGEEQDDAVAFVVVGAAFGLAAGHR